MKEKLIMPPITVPFKWLVGVITISISAIGSVAVMFIWVGSQSTKVEAHDRDIIRVRDTIRDMKSEYGTNISKMGERTARVETILEYAFPKEAAKVPKTEN